MERNLVRWNDLHNTFNAIFPNTVRDVLDNRLPKALVRYLGYDFEIRPRPGLPSDFDIWGPLAMELSQGVNG